jgi:hypothetical protein
VETKFKVPKIQNKKFVSTYREEDRNEYNMKRNGVKREAKQAKTEAWEKFSM